MSDAGCWRLTALCCGRRFTLKSTSASVCRARVTRVFTESDAFIHGRSTSRIGMITVFAKGRESRISFGAIVCLLAGAIVD